MSVRKLTARILGTLVVLCGLSSAQAQDRFPIADPMEFEPDFRWFEPIYDMDLADMKPKKRANTGWFATYDRLMLYASRPELLSSGLSEQSGDANLDRGYGHRYEIGYMLDDDSGWMFSAVRSGVNDFFTVRHEAANRVNDDELGGTATNPGPPFGFEAIPGISNNLGFNFRFFDEMDSENVLDFNSYELSKTWRMEPYHYGGILEPMIGFRWFRIKDTALNQSFLSSNTDPTSPQSLALVAQFGNGVDQMTTDLNETDNEAITTQLGFRYTKFRDRFTFSSDFRAFAGINYQNSRAIRGVTTVVYDNDPVTQGDDIDRILRSQTTPIYMRDSETFIGFDVRGELAYQLTRSITLRGGMQMISAYGVWRGGDPSFNLTGGARNQDLQLVGATLGLTLNR
ncbi:MAG: hypothetical protein AAFX06_06595 [Planctomycetota bacterium]